MSWVTRTLSSSVGKKLLMAISGFAFLGFLAGHLAGNLTIYWGKDAFNSYAKHLHDLGPFLVFAEIGLVVFAAIHIGTALFLFFQNRAARPVKYAVDKTGGGGRTLSSRTMPYTGLLVLIFVVIHILNFSHHIVDQSTRTIAQITGEFFSNKGYMAFYMVMMVIVALHVRHGLWSAFQTIGANHPKYMPLIERLSVLFAVVVGIGFGLLPIVIVMKV
ncbi:MAG TPA: succinate dehydrogenase cytochrome b subunit [Syntrophobacteria bacterium]|nr:succinate dehydrogenase cytochrome b subunit [Syntrophobacteria bacterium]